MNVGYYLRILRQDFKIESKLFLKFEKWKLLLSINLTQTEFQQNIAGTKFQGSMTEELMLYLPLAHVFIFNYTSRAIVCLTL